MKKTGISLLFLFYINAAAAQEIPAYQKGRSTVAVSHGIFNIWTYFLKNAFSYPENTYSVSSKGPYAITYEYGFSPRISGGLALGYSIVTGKFKGFGYNFTEKLTGLTILARGNYHFLVKSKKFDPYAGAGIGVFKFNNKNDAPGTINNKVPGNFGYSLQAGSNFYFNQTIGLHAEIGYIGAGGSLGEAGLILRF